MIRSLLISCVLAVPATADTARYSFEWTGGGGYSMRGALGFDAALLTQGLILETDLSCFEVEGFLNDVPLGRWALGMLLPETTWQLTFSPAGSEFVVFGEDHPMPQAWNMDGFGENCGSPGFGFNIGNAAQDICVDGALIVRSQVPPPQPFPVEFDPNVQFSKDACRPSLLLSRLEVQK